MKNNNVLKFLFIILFLFISFSFAFIQLWNKKNNIENEITNQNNILKDSILNIKTKLNYQHQYSDSLEKNIAESEIKYKQQRERLLLITKKYEKIRIDHQSLNAIQTINLLTTNLASDTTNKR